MGGTPIDPALAEEAVEDVQQDGTSTDQDLVSEQMPHVSVPPGQPNLAAHPADPYRLPSVPQMYAQPPYPQMQYAAQPAPRQRTAIACRYCRRRKIRCSGFDQSEDGRCTNCQRFSQECVFTPVSAQAQAFVPAHAAWRGQNPPPNTQFYGAYGQPLPQAPPQQQQQQQQPGQYPPPPQGYQQQPMYPQEAGRKRGNDEPHTPTHPPPNPGMQYSDPSGVKEDGTVDEKKERNTKDVGVQVDLLK